MTSSTKTFSERLKPALQDIIPLSIRHKRNEWRKYLVNLYYIARSDSVLLYQMSKTGSRSLRESLLAVNIPTARTHRMRAGYLPLLKRKKKLRMITLVREPLGRHVSHYFHNFHHHVGMEFRHSNHSVNELGKIFLNDPQFQQPPIWFDEHIKAEFGLDIFIFPFPKDRGYTIIKQDHIELLVLKLELDDAVKVEAISQFLGIRPFPMLRSNVAKTKGYAQTYQSFRKTFPFPKTTLDTMYNSRYAHHFYTEQEITNFRRKWLEDPTR